METQGTGNPRTERFLDRDPPLQHLFCVPPELLQPRKGPQPHHPPPLLHSPRHRCILVPEEGGSHYGGDCDGLPGDGLPCGVSQPRGHHPGYRAVLRLRRDRCHRLVPLKHPQGAGGQVPWDLRLLGGRGIPGNEPSFRFCDRGGERAGGAPSRLQGPRTGREGVPRFLCRQE